MVELTTLGTLDLRDPAGTAVDPVLSQPKRLAVLLYLALETPGGFTRRDTLLALFWPDSDAAHARNSLSKTLSVLRRALGEDVIVTRGHEEVGLDPDRIRCDAVAFDETIDAGRLEDALELYEGDLAPGFHADASAQFDQWLEAERKRRRQAALAAARELAGRAREARRFQEAVAWARQARAIAPLSERAVRDLVEALAATGDRTAALDVFETFTDRLAAEYELEPSQELTERVQAIAEGSVEPPAAGRPAGAPAGPADTLRSGRPDPDDSRTFAPGQDGGAGSGTGAVRVTPRRVALGVLSVALLALLAGRWWIERSEPPSSGAADGSPTHSVAVLPFSSLSPDPDNQYFSDGLAEEILNLLAQVDGLDVAARTSSFAYRHEGTDVRQIGTDLGVGAVLEGSVRKAGDRVRVTAQLVRTSDAFHLWSDAWDRRLDDIFRIQEDIARQIVRSLRVELEMPVKQAVKRRRPTDDMEAYQLFLQARHLFHQRTGESLMRSVDLYREAIERDSTFAEAYGGLAMTYMALPSYRTPDLGYDAVARARAMADRGLELDSTLAQAYAVQGYSRFTRSSDVLGARMGLDRARELEPDNSTVSLWTALVELTAGRLEAADTLLQSALELDPATAGIVSFYMGWLADLQGETDRALDLHQRAHDLGYPWARAFVCITAAIAHRYDEVRERWCDPASLGDEDQGADWILDLDRIMEQGPAENMRYLETWSWGGLWLGPPFELPGPFFAALHSSFFATHIWSYIWHPTAAAYRRDPRFAAWVRRMHLPEYWDATSWPDFCSRTGDGEIRCH